MKAPPLKIVQISDLHLLADKKGSLLGVNTQDSFKAVLDLLEQESDKMDAIILSGDLSQDGSAPAYIHIANLIKSLAVPVYYVPGNHDNVSVMMKVYPRDTILNEKHIILRNWQIILLNSQKKGAVEGYLDEEQLQFLQHCLRTHPQYHAIVLFHHQAMPVGCTWLDKLGLTNANQFWDIIGHFSQVRAVVFGHVHQSFEQKKNGVMMYAPPSTCIQFKPNIADFKLDPLPPGYRIFYLFEDGHIETVIRRVKHYIGIYDEHAKGY